jgi:hypothetical protein
MDSDIPWGLILLLAAVALVIYAASQGVSTVISTAGTYWYLVIPVLFFIFALAP